MDGQWWKQGNPQSREVSQQEIDRAQALNYNAAGPLLSAGMSRAGLGTDAANKMVWARKQAEWEASRRPGVVQIGTDPNANPGLARIPTDGQTRTFAPSQPSALDLDRMAATKLVNDDPSYGRFWETPEQQQARRAERAASRGNDQARIDGQTPLYRGMAGVGKGNVNGVDTLYPIAGHVGEYSQNMGAVGLPGTGGTSVSAYEGARSGLVAGQERGRRGERFEARKAAKRAADLAQQTRINELEDKMLLETIKSQGINAPGIQDWMQANDATKREQLKYDTIEKATRGKQPDEPVQIGTEFRTVGEWRQQLTSGRPKLASYDEWRGGQGQLGDPRFAGGGQQPATAPAKSKAGRESAFAGLTPERRKIYNSWSPQQKEAYWQSVGL